MATEVRHLADLLLPWSQDADGASTGDAAELLAAAAEAVAADRPRPDDRQVWWRFLELTGRSGFLTALPSDEARRSWAEVTFAVVEGTRFALGDLLAQRCRQGPQRVLFRRADDLRAPAWTYEHTERHLRAVAAALLGPPPQEPAPSPVADGRPRVAICAENGLPTACVDLACLCHDIFVSPLNIHFNTENFVWICDRLRIDTVVVDGEERLDKMCEVRRKVARPFAIVTTDAEHPTRGNDVRSLPAEMAALGPDEIAARLDARPRFGMREVCTVMFTSGSTGQPKGVAFNQMNLVSKRFARHAALPAVGRDEVLLCYLPLFHTFGRYLELLGSIYWHGTYAFAGNPSMETLLNQLQQVRPTGLISIPLRWVQIYERCVERFGTDAAAERRDAIFAEVSGGRLRWGLSAAGYLDPRIFRFFQRQGVQLCSGFGMTEGTGGLTMTPPQEYVENSVGVPLPGVATRFTDQGELQIAGPYVARYLPDEAPPGDLTVAEPDSDEHWLATGDLFRDRDRGHLEIVDRIKDIYKNVKGQTIAPRKVESVFTGVPGIARTFLVGDSRAYNTLLIVPDRDDDVLSKLANDDEEHDYFQRLVTQANLDLAPYERVVNFTVLDRDFSADEGELTPKGSFRRKAIVENFRAPIEELYANTEQQLSCNGLTVVIPRWFFRDLGLLEGSIQAAAEGLIEVGRRTRLALYRDAGSGRLRLGDLDYALDGDVVHLGIFARQPLLWAGNPALSAFAPCKVGWDAASPGIAEQVRLPERDPEQLQGLTAGVVPGTEMHEVDALCQQALFGPVQDAMRAVDRLEEKLATAGDRLGNLIRRRLEALANHPVATLRCRAYQVLVLDEPVPDYNRYLPAFIESGKTFLTSESVETIASAAIEPRRLHALRQRMHTYREQLSWPADEIRRRVFDDLFHLLADFARHQPEFYGPVREELVSWVLHDADPELSRRAEQHFHDLAAWFETLLREDNTALEPARWRGKIVFQEGLASDEIERLEEMLVGTTFLQESVLLACDGDKIDLADVGPGGIWVSRIRSHHRFWRYRVSINTKAGKHFDFQMVITAVIDNAVVLETIFWLIALRGYPFGSPVLPPFGCCRPELGALSLGYVSDLTVWEKVREYSSVRGPGIRPPTPRMWRHLLVRGWVASGRRIVPGMVTAANVVVPEPDFREDNLLQSVIGWRRYQGPVTLIRPLVKNFFAMISSHYPWISEHLRLEWIFDACRETLGRIEGRAFLDELRAALDTDPIAEAGPDLAERLGAYLEQIDRRYAPPLALENALARYAEWQRVNPQATQRARLEILDELQRLYRLERFGAVARYHLFRHTYFANAALPVVDLLDRILAKLHADPRQRATELVELPDLQGLLTNPNDRLGFRRLAFPRSRRREDVEVMTIGDRERSHVIVRSYITDRQGESYPVYEPTGPVEVGEVYRHFLKGGYPKTVRERDRFLVVANDREQVIGGVCYQLAGDGVVHLDGIVVARALHDRGITSALLEDFCERMTEEGHRVIVTHFFLRGFYLKRGFQIDRRWGGLVRFL